MKEDRIRAIEDHEEHQWQKALQARKSKDLGQIKRIPESSGKSSHRVAFDGRYSVSGLQPGEPSPYKLTRYNTPFTINELEPGTRSASPTVKNTTVFSTPINKKLR